MQSSYEKRTQRLVDWCRAWHPFVLKGWEFKLGWTAIKSRFLVTKHAFSWGFPHCTISQGSSHPQVASLRLRPQRDKRNHRCVLDLEVSNIQIHLQSFSAIDQGNPTHQRLCPLEIRPYEGFTKGQRWLNIPFLTLFFSLRWHPWLAGILLAVIGSRCVYSEW